MRINIQTKLLASYIFVAVICTILLVSVSTYEFVTNFQEYSEVEKLEPAERFFVALFNEGKVPDIRYLPPSMEDKFFESVSESLINTGLGTLALALLLSLAFSRAIVNPTRKLINATKEIAGGDYSKRVNIRSRDELGDLGKALNQMAENLEKIESMRRELVSNVSHELATPLTNISGYLEALHDKVIEGHELTENTLVLLREEADRLTSMVEDLRELSRIESSSFKLTFEQMDAGDVIEEVMRNFEKRFEEKNIQTSISIQSNLPPVYVDRNGLTQILVNLIDNAVVFTPENGRVNIIAMRKSDHVEIEIADSGIGISPDDLPHIFERFYRGDKSRSRKAGGTGIGLAIVQELVKLQGGAINVTSEPGKGSRFTFDLPTRK